MQPFSSLALTGALLNNLASLGYESMTPIQAESLPIILTGKDVIAQAKTGSGKTVAFGLALLNRLDPNIYTTQALVLCPTRELAEQVSQVLRQLARLIPNVKVLNLSGGLPMRAQTDSLKHGAHIIVGTPGRVFKMLENKTLNLKNLQRLVLDEADRMLDMGFYDAINDIISFCPIDRQTLLFSATYPAEIKKLAQQFLKDPKRIIVEEKALTLDIEQVFYALDNQKNKYALLKTLLLHHQPESTLIFCNTKEQTVQLAKMLAHDKFSAIALNGDMEQADRDVAVLRFKNKSCSILVATDVAARGLDIEALPAVINFDLAYECDVHTHRIGRTGRAGNKGLAISLTTQSDSERLTAIETALMQPLTWGEVSALDKSKQAVMLPTMQTLYLSAGKKDKIRPGDILGSLTKELGLSAESIGKIDVGPLYTYVAIQCKHATAALNHFNHGKLKGRKINARLLK
ncbi:MAG TPA: ATP-dependent RNA helicase DbpA [Gammaproteobacteria bacterium]|nr:ATP-dependent RNA helicase DbpA [Gammaproteobacteria bacterium]